MSIQTSTTTLGRNLRTAREAKSWSRAVLARESGTSPAAIARAELYGKQPRLSTIRLWADALGVSLAVLVTEEAA